MIAVDVPMNRKEFSTFVSSALEEAIEFAEEKAGQKLPRMLAFQWLFHSNQLITDNIVEEIVTHVFIDEEHIHPSVHLGVADLLEDGSLLIVVQPCLLQTPTALTGGDNTPRNPWIGKLLLNR